MSLYARSYISYCVSGGLMDVVDNSSHFDDPYTLKKEYEVNPDLAAGDKYGKSWYNKKHLKVNRILECGKNVKSDDAPVYAGMDWKGYKKSRFYKYNKPLKPVR